MEVNDGNFDTTSGASEPQGSVVVGGSGLKTGSNVAGPLRSLSNECEGARVASQAPDTLTTTSAEKTRTVVPQAAPAFGSTTMEIHRTTLADRLIASGNNAQGSKLEKLAEKSTEQLREILEDKEKTEKDCFDRVGRRLNAMLDAVREAKNVAKPVQAALAEAMNAYKQATSARKQRQQVADLLSEQARNTALPVVASNPMDSASPLLEEIRMISSKLNDHGDKIAALTAALTGDEDTPLPWTKVVKRKASTKAKTETGSNEAPRAQTKTMEFPWPPRP